MYRYVEELYCIFVVRRLGKEEEVLKQNQRSIYSSCCCVVYFYGNKSLTLSGRQRRENSCCERERERGRKKGGLESGASFQKSLLNLTQIARAKRREEGSSINIPNCNILSLSLFFQTLELFSLSLRSLIDILFAPLCSSHLQRNSRDKKRRKKEEGEQSF